MNDIDYEILYGYFFSSRYVTRDIFSKYGLDPTLYTPKQNSRRIDKLKKRLKELLIENTFESPSSGEELRKLLGVQFEWVRSSLDTSNTKSVDSA